MKLLVGLFGLFLCVTLPAVADDDVDDLDEEVVSQAVVERKSCAQIKAEMDALVAETDPDDDQVAELDNLRSMYRRTCMLSASGRQTSGRVATNNIAPRMRGAAAKEAAAAAAAAVPALDVGTTASVASTAGATAAAVVATTTNDTVSAIDEFLAKKKENCDALESEISRLSVLSDAESVKMLATLQAQFSADCGDADDAALAAAAQSDQTAEERDAEIAANIEKGLCADGTRPNKFGCCAGEKFTDMGNLVFACCPPEGECFQPITK